MNPITSLSGLVSFVKTACQPKRLAVAWPHDEPTFDAVARAVAEGLVHPLLIGQKEKITRLAKKYDINPGVYDVLEYPDPGTATAEALRQVKSGEADILMKGLVGTDIFLRVVLDKVDGLLPKGNILSYVCALQIPGADRLFFISDTAVLPDPDLVQKKAMIKYAVDMAHRFGINTPRVALIEATEKVGETIPSTLVDAVLCKMADQGAFGNCIVDGPMDVFLATDPAAGTIKQVPNKMNGMADVMIFPSLVAANVFYKGLVRFAGAELAGLLQGTTKPVVVMSRSESPQSKFYCIALSVLEANHPN